MTLLKYLHDRSLDDAATVLSVGEYRGQPYAILDQTIFHRAGGGQLGDRGCIGDAIVTDVILNRDTGETLHLLAHQTLSINARVRVRVDPEWRHLNSRCHTAGHLIAGLVEQDLPDLRATKGHHWPGECRVEFAIEQNCAKANAVTISARIRERFAEVILENRPIVTLVHPDGMRYIQILGLPPVPCGGTHVESTAQLHAVGIKGVKVKNESLKISYEVTQDF